MGHISYKHINTEPGSGYWAAPKEAVDNYREWLIETLSLSQGHMQYFGFLANFNKVTSADPEQEAPVFSGPYADDLRQAVTRDYTEVQGVAATRRSIRVEAESSARKRKASETEEKNKDTSTNKKAGPKSPPRPKVVPPEDWKPTSAAKARNQSFMEAFNKQHQQAPK